MKMMFVALIHTEGVILSRKYNVLELAYSDILGTNKHFLIKSPISYTEAKQRNKYLHKSLQVIMCKSNYYYNERVYTIDEIKHFLKSQYVLLNLYYGPSIQFGYKGKSYQKDILKECNIPCVNIETFGVPSIKRLIAKYPRVKKYCFYHKLPYNKCAEHILRLINTYIFENYY